MYKLNESYSVADLSEIDGPEAVALAITEYQEEQQKACLPSTDENLTEELSGVVWWALGHAKGKGLICDGKLVGYLAFYGPWDGFFGNCRGMFSPLGANAFAKEQKGKNITILLTEVLRDYVKEKTTQYAISRYAHDEEGKMGFFYNGFGARCSDAFLKLSDYRFHTPSSDISFVRLEGSEKGAVREMFIELDAHLGASPCFFPSAGWEEDWAEWSKKDEKHVIAAKKDSELIGYFAYQDEGETFVTQGRCYNICGAYVKKEYRSLDIAKLLLDEIVRISVADGMEYLGVDYETINPSARSFWTKYFVPYTYSVVRRIDERIC